VHVLERPSCPETLRLDGAPDHVKLAHALRRKSRHTPSVFSLNDWDPGIDRII
jgi:hypothetical protein